LSFTKAFLGRFKAVKYAYKGSVLLLTEHSIVTQLIITVIMALAGWLVGINRYEWMIQLLLCGAVMTAEGINTAIEALCDFVHPDFNDKIGIIKDLAAGAVFVMSVIAVIIGMIIYAPYLYTLLHG
jgi:diacylglycerol kinase (ATP)